VEKIVGKDEMKHIPYGAIAFYTLADKLYCGMQQLLAGARKFSVKQITRDDIFAGNRETARETGIRHMADANDESAKRYSTHDHRRRPAPARTADRPNGRNQATPPAGNGRGRCRAGHVTRATRCRPLWF
jgi:hypothetical protein